MAERSEYPTETESSELAAFSRIYRSEVSALVGYARRFVDEETAHDIVHDVFTRIWAGKQFKLSEREIRRYLFRCVLNACRDYVRHRQVELGFASKASIELQLYELDYHEVHWEYAPDERQFRAVLREIDKLPDRCKEIFKQVYLNGKKSREIAEELHISQRTVEAQLYKALKIIRQALTDLMLSILLFCGHHFF